MTESNSNAQKKRMWGLRTRNFFGDAGGRGRVMNFSGGRARAGDTIFWTGGHSLKFVGRVRAGDEKFFTGRGGPGHPFCSPDLYGSS